MRMRDRFARVLPFKARGGEAASDTDYVDSDTAPETAALAVFLGGVYGRECAGQSTSLRQIHNVAGIDQSIALKLVARLQNDGMITVISALHDEFESRIELTETAKRKLAQLAEPVATPSIRR